MNGMIVGPWIAWVGHADIWKDFFFLMVASLRGICIISSHFIVKSGTLCSAVQLFRGWLGAGPWPTRPVRVLPLTLVIVDGLGRHFAGVSRSFAL